MRYTTWIRALSMAVLLALQAGAVRADPEIGWWWNSAESGRGFFIESHDGIFFMAAYFYADDGRARWLAAGGNNADPYNYSGQLQEYRGGQTLYGSYVAPGTPVDSGAITVSFSDDTHGTIVWPGGTIPIVRYTFDSGTASFQPEPGWWWNPAESGSGYSIEVQGGSFFMAGFMYDDAGNPVWYLSAGPMSSPTNYKGDLVVVANGQTLTGPYRPPSTPTRVGTLAIEFTAPDAATLTFTGVGAVASAIHVQAGQSRTVSAKREFTSQPHPYDFPPGYTYSGNTFHQYLIRDESNPVETVYLTFIADGRDFIWTKSGEPTPVLQSPGDLLVGTAEQRYVISYGSVDVVARYQSISPIGTCGGATDPKTFVFVPFDTTLTVTNQGEYRISIGMQDTILNLTIPVTCNYFGIKVNKSLDTKFDIEIIGRGIALSSGSLQGSFKAVPGSNPERSGWWSVIPN
jgi:hypothetical protein